MVNTNIRPLVLRAADFLLKPRSQNRDEAFREQTIRITISLVVGLVVLSLLTSVLIFHDMWEPVSFQTIEVIALVLCACSAYSIARQQILLAGIFLVVLFLTAAAGSLALPQQIKIEGLGTSVFMIAILTGALVLPRSVIVWLALVATVVTALLLFIVQPNNAQNQDTIWSAAFMFIAEGLFLRQLRVEFDSRL